jgi:hypothetical protein
VETFADVLKALGVESLDVDDDTRALAVRGTNRLMDRNGKLWIWQHRVRLIEELELIDSM